MRSSFTQHPWSRIQWFFSICLSTWLVSSNFGSNMVLKLLQIVMVAMSRWSQILACQTSFRAGWELTNRMDLSSSLHLWHVHSSRAPFFFLLAGVYMPMTWHEDLSLGWPKTIVYRYYTVVKWWIAIVMLTGCLPLCLRWFGWWPIIQLAGCKDWRHLVNCEPFHWCHAVVWALGYRFSLRVQKFRSRNRFPVTLEFSERYALPGPVYTPP